MSRATTSIDAPDGSRAALGGACVRGLAVALTVHDSMRTLERVLRSVQPLAERIVVVDSGSRDGSVECARTHGAEVVHRAWEGHVRQKQSAVDACRGAAWVLLLDSDEIVGDDLAAAIRAALAVEPATTVGFELNRRLVFHGVTLRYAYQPEWRLRLFRAACGRIAGTPPHDRVEVACSAGQTIGRLRGDLLHDSWANAEDMLRRQLGYARIIASDPATKGGGTLLDILIRPGASFVKHYLLKQGCRDGWRGLVTAGGAAAGALMKHIALAERRHGSIEQHGAHEPPGEVTDE